MIGKLILKSGLEFIGRSFGFKRSVAGELVFSTGMVGYPETLTDPSYEGQILLATYPIIGSYGVPDKKFWESSRIHVAGLIVNQYINTPSHFQSQKNLDQWLQEEKIPGLEIEDTRYLTEILRNQGTQLAKIIFDKDIDFDDPNKKNLVDRVSTKEILKEGRGKKTIVLIDCGVKENIKRCLLKRNVKLITVAWNYDIFLLKEKIDGVVVSNGPGDPRMCHKTIETVKKILAKKLPFLGICLGNQILALAAGGSTYRLKYGHRSQNQPCIEQTTKRCFITTQNHGFAIDKVPSGFKTWFINANDGTNEGIIHEKYPFMSVQFHPEAMPGPNDTEWIFDKFLDNL